MFDFGFNGTRNLAIAEVHGLIPFEILIKILPLFKLWIVQMDTEEELQENYEQFLSIKQKLQLLNSECCFIIRNSQTKDVSQLGQLEENAKNQGISIYKIIDLTQKGLDKQKINQEIESFTEFIFGIIQNQKTNLSNLQDFLTILQNYYENNLPEMQQIQQDFELLESLMYEMQEFNTNSQGFYSQNAFPNRSLRLQIKNNDSKLFQLYGLTKDQSIQQVESIKKEINKLEQQILESKPSHILELFQKIFDSQNFYSLYQKFIDQIGQLNQQNKIAQDKIGIELFWRELIQIKQKGCKAQLKMNPAEIIANLVKKGEPFEFLDGDQLEIVDIRFLEDFMKQFSNLNQKVLIVSILGPQGSGKSTLLNQMFGCHFSMSERKYTKGIQLQFLKITQKSSFEKKFDYLLVFDAEGLQNPKFIDPEFDNKVTLFILNVSDIIFINAKGDIPTQFQNLIKMCICTLGTDKIFSWCFNQNNDIQNFSPFLQTKNIINTLNSQVSQTIEKDDTSSFDYNEVLDLQDENSKFFGFSSTEQTWSENTYKKIQWRQKIVSQTFQEEVYLYGVQVINKFFQKKDNDKNFKLLSKIQFIQSIESTWQSVRKFSDIEKFSLVLEQKQIQLLEAKYEQIYKKQSFYVEIQIQSQIQNLVFGEQQKDLEFFQKFEDSQKQYIKQEIEKIYNMVQKDLLQYKNKYQILDRIFRNFMMKLNQSLKNYELNCLGVLTDEVERYKREYLYLYQEEYPQMEHTVAKICQNTLEFKRLKDDMQLQKQQFDEIWSFIISKAEQKQENVYKEFVQAQYKGIKFACAQYLQTNQEQLYNFIFNLSENTSKNNLNDEYTSVVTDFLKLIQFKDQLQIVSKQNIKYNDIFHQPIKMRLKKSQKNDIVDLNEFYQHQAVVYSIQSEEFSKYLKGDAFYQDFFSYKKQQQKQNSMNQEQIFYSFFSILEIFQIKFNQEKYNELKNFFIKGNGLIISLFDFRDPRKIFEQFQQTFNFSQLKFQTVKNIEFTRNMNTTYPSLSLEKNQICGNRLDELDELFQKLNGKIQFLFSQIILPRNNTHQIFHYIQINNKIQIYQFNEFSLSQFESIILPQNRRNQIYFEIYQIIKIKMTQLISQIRSEIQSRNQQQNDSEQEIIKFILSIIEQKILEYNKQFANFGVILSVNGQNCIYYYTIFIIWRLLCYSKWNQLQENYQQLFNIRDQQLKRFIANIQLNQKEQSILNAQSLFNILKFGFLEKFYIEQQSQVKQSIESIDMSCNKIVQILDDKLLINYERAQQNIIKDDILSYIFDQKSYIIKYVEEKIQLKENEIKQQYQEKLRRELGILFKQIYQNVSNIEAFTSQQLNALKSEEYFETNYDEINTCHYDSQLFYLLFNCILGTKLIDENLLKIKRQYKELFKKNYQLIEILKYISPQNESETKIPQLKPFIEELLKLVEQQIQEIENEPLSFQNLSIQDNQNKVKFNMIGCLHQCPICNRKCDQQNDNNHKHTCYNGHQYQEIDDDATITILETQTKKKWKEIKIVYSDWNFKGITNEESEKLNEKMKDIWESGIGNLIYKEYSNIFPIHYILMLAYSEFTEGKQWENEINRALSCLKYIQKNAEAKVSVIIFNTIARVVIDCQDVNIENSQGLIAFEDGITSFHNPFLAAYNQIIKHQYMKFERTLILFHKDGCDEYPIETVNKFCQLPQKIKESIQLVSFAESNFLESESLIKITQQFLEKGIDAELKTNVRVEDLKKVWTEAVTQSYHNLKY